MALVVYKSSAGSGKTATLVLEYLQLCLPNPSEFKRTLAITFTNKAAGEMKSRIISTLELGAKGNENFLLIKLKTILNIDSQKLQSLSQELLSLILHNYDEFAVSTIDSFVHRVVRTFANEINLPANFEVILDNDDIVPEIVDELYDKVGNETDLTNIMLSYVMSQIEEEKSHNLDGILSSFVGYNLSEEIFEQKEFIQSLKLADFTPMIKRLVKKQNALKGEVEKYAKDAINLFDSVSLSVDDLSYKKGGIYGFFDKIRSLVLDDNLVPGKRAINTIEENKWLAAKANENIKSAIEIIKEELIGLFYSIKSTAKEYFLIKFINSRIYSVALTTEIQNLFAEFVERTGKVHISEFNKRISESIADQPIPFLYERLGFKYKHFLIDEFQDTSVLQWDNLLPLVEESLASNNFNMLVGDAKQAIYRFRGGEVELFTNLPELYNNDGSQLSQSRVQLFKNQIDERFLEVNYRSNKHIVEFNNEFFSYLLQSESDRYKKNYEKLEQKIHNSEDGFVSLNIVDAENVAEYSEKRLEIIEGFVSRSIATGFKPSDICVLCRRKKQIGEIASHLISKNYSIVSSESLLVANSPRVSLIVSFLRLLIKPNEKILLADFVFKYFGLLGSEDAEKTFKKLVNGSIPFPDAVLNLIGTDKNAETLLPFSVYEICELLIKALHFEKSTDAFIQYFLDFVFKVQQSGSFTLKDFLTVWDDKKSKVFVELPEDENAIKLMTAHKSKGLDFEVVIADLYYAKMHHSKDFWAEINIEGEEKLTKTMLPLSKSISKIEMEDVYNVEQEKERLDFLNLVYVTFTRASKALFAVGANQRDSFGKLLTNYVAFKYPENEDHNSYEFGKLKYISKEKKDESEGVKITLDSMLSTDWHSIIEIAASEDIYWEASDFTKPASFGKLVHKILSEIQYSSDILKSVSKYRMMGIIDRDEEIKIIAIAEKVVEHPMLKKYFTEGVLVKNETELYDKNGRVIRPDRVVKDGDELIIIDYKTGDKDKKHIYQINEYAEVFADLGFDLIRRFLVYIGDQVVVEDVR